MLRRKRLTFWGADEYDDSLPRSVIEGRKTVTADTVEDHWKPCGEYCDDNDKPGDIIEVCDLQRELYCTIEATKVYNIRCGNSPGEVWRGETFSSAEEFRDVYVRVLPHLQLHDDFERVALHFKLIAVVGEISRR